MNLTIAKALMEDDPVLDDLAGLFQRPDWFSEALCKGMDPETFHPGARNYEAHDTIRDFCFQCPVRLQCLGYALRTDTTEGWWGGHSPAERRVMAKERRKAQVGQFDPPGLVVSETGRRRLEGNTEAA